MSGLRREPVKKHDATTQQSNSSRVPARKEVPSKYTDATPHIATLATGPNRTVALREPSRQEALALSNFVGPTSQSSAISPAPMNAVPQFIGTPSLFSGSSASTFDSPRPNTLRRKPYNAIDKYAAQKRSDSVASDLGRQPDVDLSDSAYRGSDNDTVFGISLPPPTAGFDNRHNVEIAYDLEGRNLSRSFTPMLNGYESTGTPSTRCTDSPFSHAPTPSSTSSYSPALVVTSNTGRSPAKKRLSTSGPFYGRANESQLGLPSVRETSTSSDSTTGTRPDLSRRKGAPPVSSNASKQTSESTRQTTRNRLTKAKPHTDMAKSKVQFPPELAHLNVDTARHGPSIIHKANPPPRPSRSGTADIVDMRRPSPVVQTELAHLYQTRHKRTSYQDAASLPASPARTRFGFSSRSSSRTASPRIDSAISPTPSTRQFQRSRTPDVATVEVPRLHRKDSPALLPHPSPAKSSRFGFFSRKSKPDVPKATEKPKRQPSRGPAAGTGHEGYSKFGSRGRSGSSTSTDYRSTSADSGSSGFSRPWTRRKGSNASSDASDFDEFLRERMHPVILRGKLPDARAVGSARHGNDAGPSFLRGTQSSHLLPSPFKDTAPRSSRPASDQFNSSDNGQDDPVARRRELVSRRLSTNLQSRPVPMSTTHPDARSQQQSRSLRSNDPELSVEGVMPVQSPRPRGESAAASVAKTRPENTGSKWNFLQRASAKTQISDVRKTTGGPAVAVHPQPLYRAVAHYAMLDHVETVELAEVTRMTQDESDEEDFLGANVSMLTEKSTPIKQVSVAHPTFLAAKDESLEINVGSCRPQLPSIAIGQHSKSSPSTFSKSGPTKRETSCLQSGERAGPSGGLRLYPWASGQKITPRPASGISDCGSPEPFDTSATQSRLSSVGRIPAVVSRRDRDRTLSSNSFSRPFATTQPRPSVKPPGSVYSQIREMASPVDSSSQPVSSTSTRSDGVFADPSSSSQANPSVPTARTSMDGHAEDGFLVFPSRKGSEQSYQSVSSSSGNTSWLNLVLPPQHEDDWDDEYNDFMDEVIPLATATTCTSLGTRSQYSDVLHDRPQAPMQPLPAMTRPPSSQIPQLPGAAQKTMVLTVPQQVSRFLRPSMSPMSPDTVTAFIDGYGDVNCSTSTVQTCELAIVPTSRHAWAQERTRSSNADSRSSVASSRHSHSSTNSRSASLPDTDPQKHRDSTAAPNESYQKDMRLVDIAEMPTEAVGSKVNLRLGALMTSKWLSFGRVLFSPAHHEIQLADEPRILVVDGLTSDWAQCVARTYPCAKVYNMTAQAPGVPAFAWPESDEPAPNNFRQIPLASISDSFPFPKGFFTSVVFRFPTASTEKCYSACISECRRVLRSGGHLEVVVLDLDLRNMGPKARLAVRGLKTRMQQCDPDVCLKNLSDTLVRIVGQQDLEAVQRCMVGVPVAGKLPRRGNFTTGSVSSDSSDKLSWAKGGDTTRKESSFADILEDARANLISSGNESDEKLTKMMARVGRWWYAACYEKALLPSDRSIWTDTALLRECYRQGTSFRLLICHAQKPFQTCRRTVSV